MTGHTFPWMQSWMLAVHTASQKRAATCVVKWHGTMNKAITCGAACKIPSKGWNASPATMKVDSFHVKLFGWERLAKPGYPKMLFLLIYLFILTTVCFTSNYCYILVWNFAIMPAYLEIAENILSKLCMKNNKQLGVFRHLTKISVRNMPKTLEPI